MPSSPDSRIITSASIAIDSRPLHHSLRNLPPLNIVDRSLSIDNNFVAASTWGCIPFNNWILIQAAAERVGVLATNHLISITEQAQLAG